MAVSSEELKNRSAWDGDEDVDEKKGKAVFVAHAWTDFLWDMGSSKKMEAPEPREVLAGREQSEVNEEEEEEEDDDSEGEEDDDEEENEHVGPLRDDTAPTTDAGDEGSGPYSPIEQATEPVPDTESSTAPKLSPEGRFIHITSQMYVTDRDSFTEVSACLRSALLQAISTTLKSLPASDFPITASIFWTTHVLPARPAHVDVGAADIKHSTHKSVKVFLKASAKEGLIKLKESKGDVLITGTLPGCDIRFV